jgi:zona occludens toxin (predicted ATPase)
MRSAKEHLSLLLCLIALMVIYVFYRIKWFLRR